MAMSAGVAVAMFIVPALLVLIIILGRYLRGDVESNDGPRVGLFSEIGWLLGLPFRLVGRLLARRAHGRDFCVRVSLERGKM